MTWILLLKCLRALRRWHLRRQTVRALSQLDEHLLNDIGIDRYDIPTVARQMAEAATAFDVAARPEASRRAAKPARSPRPACPATPC